MSVGPYHRILEQSHHWQQRVWSRHCLWLGLVLAVQSQNQLWGECLCGEDARNLIVWVYSLPAVPSAVAVMSPVTTRAPPNCVIPFTLSWNIVSNRWSSSTSYAARANPWTEHRNRAFSQCSCCKHITEIPIQILQEDPSLYERPALVPTQQSAWSIIGNPASVTSIVSPAQTVSVKHWQLPVRRQVVKITKREGKSMASMQHTNGLWKIGYWRTYSFSYKNFSEHCFAFQKTSTRTTA